jgi:hypothetical protein
MRRRSKMGRLSRIRTHGVSIGPVSLDFDKVEAVCVHPYPGERYEVIVQMDSALQLVVGKYAERKKAYDRRARLVARINAERRPAAGGC